MKSSCKWLWLKRVVIVLFSALLIIYAYFVVRYREPTLYFTKAAISMLFPNPPLLEETIDPYHTGKIQEKYINIKNTCRYYFDLDYPQGGTPTDRTPDPFCVGGGSAGCRFPHGLPIRLIISRMGGEAQTEKIFFSNTIQGSTTFHYYQTVTSTNLPPGKYKLSWKIEEPGIKYWYGRPSVTLKVKMDHDLKCLLGLNND